MNRRLTLLLVPLVAAYVLFPRATPRPGSEAITSSTVSPAESQSRTGAPLSETYPTGSEGRESAVGWFRYPAPEPSGAPTPRPSGGIDKGFYCSEPTCGYVEPTAKPKPLTVKASGGIVGEATWWYSFGPGIYSAIRPDLGSKGDLAIVCGGAPFHCLTVPVTTVCACLGPNSNRLIDLSRDAFSSFADPSVGVIRITLQVLK